MKRGTISPFTHPRGVALCDEVYLKGFLLLISVEDFYGYGILKRYYKLFASIVTKVTFILDLHC